MADNSGVPLIQPAQATVLDQNIVVLGDADPEAYPNGIEVVLMEPGKLTPFGRFIVQPGNMVIIPPIQMSAQLRGMIKQHMASIQPGAVPAPGVKH